MRKALLAAVCISALGLGTSALAQEAGDITNDDFSTLTGFNDTDNSVNTTTTSDGSFNDSSDNSTNTTLDVSDTLNDNSDNSVNTTTTYDDSYNDNSTTRTSVNNTTLGSYVTGVTLTFTGGALAGQSGDFVSGNSRVDTSGTFAGVQNVGSNTGYAANVLVANGISANADISFGD